MMMCIKVWVSIWPGVMVSDRRDWISLKFIWHMTNNKTQVEFKKGGSMSIWIGVDLDLDWITPMPRPGVVQYLFEHSYRRT